MRWARLMLAAVVVLVASPTWADFQAGVDAYKKGDYATALRAKLCGLLVEKPTVVQSVLETTATEVLLAMVAEYERRIATRELTHGDHG